MTRLPVMALLAVIVGLTGCAKPLHPMNDNPNKRFQKKDTAYVSVFLFKDGTSTCKAKVSPETLLVVRRHGRVSKQNVVWEVVNLCWDQRTPEVITVKFTGVNPTDTHANPKEKAEMPNPDRQVTDKSRDEIRRKLKGDPGQGAYDYVIQRQVGTGDPQTLVDPRIEYEYRR